MKTDVQWLSQRLDVKRAVVELAEGWAGSPPILAALDDQVTWHDTLVPHQPLHGVQSVAALSSLLRTALPDLRLTVEATASAEDCHILLYYTATGTHTGPFHSSFTKQQDQQAVAAGVASGSSSKSTRDGAAAVCIEPTGKSVSWTGSMVFKMQPAQAAGDGLAAAADRSAGVAGAGSGPVAVNQQLKAAAVWHSWDPLFFYQQIGFAPTSVPAAPAAAPAAPPPGAVDPDDAGCAAEECKAVVQQYFGIYNSGDFSRLPGVVHPSYHYWGLMDLGGKTGVAAMQAMMAGWRDALSDFSIGHDWVIAAEGNRVVFRWVVQGLHTKAPLRGVAAVPEQPRAIRSFGVTALSITQAQEGQPGQVWRKVSHANGADLLRQLGVFSFGVE